MHSVYIINEFFTASKFTDFNVKRIKLYTRTSLVKRQKTKIEVLILECNNQLHHSQLHSCDHRSLLFRCQGSKVKCIGTNNIDAVAIAHFVFFFSFFTCFLIINPTVRHACCSFTYSSCVCVRESKISMSSNNVCTNAHNIRCVPRY